MFRSDFKKVARQVVAKHWDWEPHDLDDSQQLLEHVQYWNYTTASQRKQNTFTVILTLR